MGVFIITVVNTVIGYFILTGSNDVSGGLGTFIPMVLIFLLSWLTARIFLGQFDEAVQAILNGMVIDMEINNGVPVNGPPSFHEKLAEIMDEDDLNAMKSNQVA